MVNCWRRIMVWLSPQNLCSFTAHMQYAWVQNNVINKETIFSIFPVLLRNLFQLCAKYSLQQPRAADSSFWACFYLAELLLNSLNTIVGLYIAVALGLYNIILNKHPTFYIFIPTSQCNVLLSWVNMRAAAVECCRSDGKPKLWCHYCKYYH